MPYTQQLTDLGRNALAESTTSLTLTFTRLGLSDERVDPDRIAELTEIGRIVMDGGIASVVNDRIGQATITSRLRLADITQEFVLMTIGIFARLGDRDEILYAVCASYGAPDVIRPASPGSTTEHTLKIATLIGNTRDVTAIFDPDIEFLNIGPASLGPGFFADRIGNTVRFKRAIGENIAISETPETVVFRGGNAVPTGGIIPFGGHAAPLGWLFCHGQAVGRLEFANLFGTLGETYGAGDGSTTFNLPDLRGRTVIGAHGGPGLTFRGLGESGGAETHQLSVAELAHHGHGIDQTPHTHEIYDVGHAHGVSQNPHNHGAIDTGHIHRLYDPTHLHYQEQCAMNDTGVTHYAFAGGDWPRNALLWMQHAFTNMTMEWAYAAISVYHALVEIGVSTAQTGVHVYHALSQLAVIGAGSNLPHNNLQPYLAINYIIRT